MTSLRRGTASHYRAYGNRASRWRQHAVGPLLRLSAPTLTSLCALHLRPTLLHVEVTFL